VDLQNKMRESASWISGKTNMNPWNKFEVQTSDYADFTDECRAED